MRAIEDLQSSLLLVQISDGLMGFVLSESHGGRIYSGCSKGRFLLQFEFAEVFELLAIYLDILVAIKM